jgi:hypothetical protein
MSEEEFLKLLKKHDWTYQHTDDHTVWQAGNSSWNRIQNLMKMHPELRKVYDKFKEENK